MQILISEHDMYDFHRRVNSHLNDGWSVVPHTLAVAMAENSVLNRMERTLCVVLEKPPVLQKHDNGKFVL